MNIREAILIIRSEKYPIRMINAITKVVDEAEKGIAIKPKTLVNDKDVKIGATTFKKGTTIYKCDICNTFTSRHHRYCSECGQKLDWD